MSGEQKKHLAGKALDLLNFLGQAASVLTIPAMLAAAYWIKLEIKSANQEQMIGIADKFVQKSDYNLAIQQLAASDSRQWEKIRMMEQAEASDKNQTDLALQHLQDVIANEDKTKKKPNYETR